MLREDWVRPWTVAFVIIIVGNMGIIQKAKALGSALFEIPAETHRLIEVGQAQHLSLDPSSIKVLIWNVYKGSKEGWVDSFKELAIGKDLVLLQEAFTSQDMVRSFESLQPLAWQMASSFVYRRHGAATGVATGSPVEPTLVRPLVSPVREPLINTPKTAMLTRYLLKDQATEPESQLLVINLHAINYVGPQGFNQHMQQLMTEIASHPGPMLLAGDFNTWSSKKMELLQTITQSLKLMEVGWEDGHHRLKTWGKYLDFAFVRGLEVRQAKVLGHVQTSDHTPLVMELYLP